MTLRIPLLFATLLAVGLSGCAVFQPSAPATPAQTLADLERTWENPLTGDTYTISRENGRLTVAVESGINIPLQVTDTQWDGRNLRFTYVTREPQQPVTIETLRIGRNEIRATQIDYLGRSRQVTLRSTLN
jgi:hypothetical protein